VTDARPGRGSRDRRQLDVEQTRASFDYQWSHLPPGDWSLASAEFRRDATGFICARTGLPRGWFAGRMALDAGCGAGRYAYALCELGARVVALDRSMAALRTTQRDCHGLPTFGGVVAANLLDPLPFRREFDLVWSFGVLHHTGDTAAAFRQLAALVRPGGYLAVMVYGRPRPGCMDDLQNVVSLESWRCRCRELSFPETASVLSRVAGPNHLLEYFDAISPRINDRHDHDEVRRWFREEGFGTVRSCSSDMDVHLVGRRAR
jgi:SAM-dependent methyltransferase